MIRGAKGPDNADDAFEVLFRREFVSITRTAYLIVGDVEVAREIAQDAFVQVLRHWEKVQAMDSPGGWVRRVAIRKAVRTRDRAGRGRSFLRTMMPALVGEPDLGDVDVHRALDVLPARQRAVIALYYLDDRPVGEIAALLGCSTGTVKTHLFRGRQALAASLGTEATDDPQ